MDSIANLEGGYIVADDLVKGIPNKIPTWHLGMSKYLETNVYWVDKEPGVDRSL